MSIKAGFTVIHVILFVFIIDYLCVIDRDGHCELQDVILSQIKYDQLKEIFTVRTVCITFIKFVLMLNCCSRLMKSRKFNLKKAYLYFR